MIYAAHSNDANCKRNKRRKEQHGNEIWIPRLSELKHNYRCVAPVNSHFAYTYLPFSALASGGANELKSRKNRIRLWDGLRWCLIYIYSIYFIIFSNEEPSGFIFLEFHFIIITFHLQRELKKTFFFRSKGLVCFAIAFAIKINRNWSSALFDIWPKSARRTLPISIWSK